jgi:hypothetical protein
VATGFGRRGCRDRLCTADFAASASSSPPWPAGEGGTGRHRGTARRAFGRFSRSDPLVSSRQIGFDGVKALAGRITFAPPENQHSDRRKQEERNEHESEQCANHWHHTRSMAI